MHQVFLDYFLELEFKCKDRKKTEIENSQGSMLRKTALNMLQAVRVKDKSLLLREKLRDVSGKTWNTIWFILNVNTKSL